MPSSAVAVFLHRFCSLLNLKQNVINAVTVTCNRVEQMGLLAGRNPATCACTCIYLVSMLKEETRRSVNDIADVAAIAASTVRAGYKTLYPHRFELIPKTYIERAAIEALPSV